MSDDRVVYIWKFGNLEISPRAGNKNYGNSNYGNLEIPVK